MAKSPRWKVYDGQGNYLASCKEPEMAAAIIGGVGVEGWTIRHSHRKSDVVWTEGIDGRAGESYDTVAVLAYQRVRERRDARRPA